MRQTITGANAAMGPLRIHPQNGRYFADAAGRPVYLTGSHTWDSLQDIEFTKTRVPRGKGPPFEYDKYLHWLLEHNHNFFRLWTWEHAAFYHDEDTSPRFYPNSYLRTGPGRALDGEPKFDLDRFDQAYFDRLRQRTAAACERGIYVSVMLFQGFSINEVGVEEITRPWSGHPFHPANNINGVNGDLLGNGKGCGVHTLSNARITAYQEAYVRRVIDAVNDFENVLYEIANESPRASRDWQYHMIEFIKGCEAGKTQQHPVGMTAHMDGGPDPIKGRFEELLNSPADWISPCQGDGAGDWCCDPPSSDGSKVIIADTDHFWGMGGDRRWVWKSFCRGLNPIYMDSMRDTFERRGTVWDAIDPRKAMGDTRRYADRMNLAGAAPSTDIATTGFCLANPGREYLVYNPSENEPRFAASLIDGEYRCEWFDPQGKAESQTDILRSKGGTHEFEAPFRGDAVLFLQRT